MKFFHSNQSINKCRKCIRVELGESSRFFFRPGEHTSVHGTSGPCTRQARLSRILLGISETRWTQAGQRRLWQESYCCTPGMKRTDAPHTQGVGFMLSRQAQRALIGWEAHGSRIITASFRTKQKKVNLNVIQCYAPTNDSYEEDKDEFYNRLQKIVETLRARDIVILMGDFNAKVGPNNTGYEQVMGIHGLGVMNDNGERFAELCAINNLVIGGGSVFPHKRIHKSTCVSPDGVTENQIDHICISKKFRRSLQDVRVRRGADVGSDHHLVVASMQLKLKRTGWKQHYVEWSMISAT